MAQEIINDEAPFPLANASTKDHIDSKDGGGSGGTDAKESTAIESKHTPPSGEVSKADNGWSLKVNWEPDPEPILYPETDEDRLKARKTKRKHIQEEEDQQREKQRKK